MTSRRARAVLALLALTGCREEPSQGVDVLVSEVLSCEAGPKSTVTERLVPVIQLQVTEEPDWRFGPVVARGEEVFAVLDARGSEHPARIVRWSETDPEVLPVAEVPGPYRITTMTAGPEALYLQAVVDEPGGWGEFPEVVFSVHGGEVNKIFEEELDGEQHLLLVGDDTLVVQLESEEFVYLSLRDGSSQQRGPEAIRAALDEADRLWLFRAVEEHGESGDDWDVRYVHQIDRQDADGHTVTVASALCKDSSQDGGLNSFLVHAGVPYWNSGRSLARLGPNGEREELGRVASDLRGLRAGADGLYFFAYYVSEFQLLRVPLTGTGVELVARLARKGSARVSGWAVTERSVYVSIGVEDGPGELWRVALDGEVF